MSTIQDLTNRIQAKVANLDLVRSRADFIEFDKYLGELDLLIYELRSLLIPKGVKAYSLTEDIHEALKELFGE